MYNIQGDDQILLRVFLSISLRIKVDGWVLMYGYIFIYIMINNIYVPGSVVILG